jgi:pyruvate dehydrogenase E2 component (dihydrolipoamide acetyltransferase)
MAQEMRMPPLGQTTEDLKILRWLMAEGDEVKLGEDLVEVETDKANLTVESFLAGTLLKVVAAEGEVVQVGDLVAYVGTPGETVPDADVTRSADSKPPAVSKPAYYPVVTNLSGPASEPRQADTSGMVAGRALASPAARQMARSQGLDLNMIEGTGPGGRIEVDDVQKAAAGES